MSNFLAIAAVTATLRQSLQFVLDKEAPAPGARVVTLRPEDLKGNTQEPKVNIYLYQVTPNTALRNADLPTRRADGSLTQRPQVALDLHYLLSFYGDENSLEPQRLLAITARTMHAQPILTHTMITQAIDALTNPGKHPDPAFSFLSQSNLADDTELVKFSPLHLSLEELSKIWSVFFQVPYILSVAYQGSVVLIESDDMPQSVLPVRERSLYPMPFKQSLIEQVIAQTPAGLPTGFAQSIFATSVILLRGQNLRGTATQIRLNGGKPQVPQSVSNTEISFSLANVAGLQSGVQGIQVINQPQINTPSSGYRGGYESNIVPFVLRPLITEVTSANLNVSGDALRSADITVTVTPGIGQQQRVVLLLNELGAAPDAVAQMYSFDAPKRSLPTTDTDHHSCPGGKSWYVSGTSASRRRGECARS